MSQPLRSMGLVVPVRRRTWRNLPDRNTAGSNCLEEVWVRRSTAP